MVRLLSWHQPVSGIESYLQQLNGWIKKLQSIPEHQVRYANREVPGLYYFMNPMLGAFKLYTFARFSWNLPRFRTDIPFSMGLFSEYQQELMAEVWNLYSKVPSEEIWNPNIWDTTLQQIIFLLEERAFKNQEDAVLLITQIESVISACIQMAEQSKKSGMEGGKFTVYNNRVLHTNNIILPVIRIRK